MADARYCWTCGAKVKRVFVTYAYDEETGKPQTYEERECPKSPKDFFGRLFRGHRVEEPGPYLP